MGSVVGSITTIIVIAIIGIAIWYFLGKPENVDELQDGLGDAFNRTKDTIEAFDFGDVLDSLEGFDWGQFFNEDPWEGNTTVTLWEEQYIDRENGGLQMVLVNSLSNTWQDEFDIAVSDWSESEALTLTVERLEVDDAWEEEKKCKHQVGKQVVCNHNVGDTGWVGINYNQVRLGRIISSVSVMNEYYLNNANFDHRRFTMCHEMGHGFGLPHTDENPYNKNLGNCLDYTDDPDENLLPGDVNFDKLNEVYLAQNMEPERKEKLRRRRRLERRDGSVIEATAILVNEDKAVDWGL